MVRMVKGAGKGSAGKRKERRQVKFKHPVGPGSHKPVGVADKPDKPKADTDAAKPKKALGKLSKKRKAEGVLTNSDGGGGGGGGDKPSKFVKKSFGGAKAAGGGTKKFFDQKTGKESAIAAPVYHNKVGRVQAHPRVSQLHS